MYKEKLQITLHAARVNAAYTQKQVAEYMNVSQSVVIDWEKGRRELNISEAKRLSKFYKIPLDNIFLPSSSNEI